LLNPDKRKEYDSKLAAAKPVSAQGDEPSAVATFEPSVRKKPSRLGSNHDAVPEIRGQKTSNNTVLWMGLAAGGVGILRLVAGIVVWVSASGKPADPPPVAEKRDKEIPVKAPNLPQPEVNPPKVAPPQVIPKDPNPPIVPPVRSPVVPQP